MTSGKLAFPSLELLPCKKQLIHIHNKMNVNLSLSLYHATVAFLADENANC